MSPLNAINKTKQIL